MAHHVFLSYSRRDVEMMQRIKQHMVDAGLQVWTDEGIKPGTSSWKRAIQQAIIDTQCLVCILSPDANQSRWVQAELDYAEMQNKPIFLILARGEEREAVPFGFATFQWIDIRQDERFSAQITALLTEMQQRMRLETSVPPPETTGGIKASRFARELAQERGVDLAKVKASREHDIIVREDVERYLADTPDSP